MNSYDWQTPFRSLYEKALSEYGTGNRASDTFFSEAEADLLASIGSRPMELYDFAEDHPSVSWETALLITAARRDYFQWIQKGVPSAKILNMPDFPAKDAKMRGIPWLPRLILKAKGKLRGELPNELMYCCGGDRRFFKQFDIHPADFLRFVWSADEDDEKIADWVVSKKPPS
jgi:hypothetical protein